MGSFSKVIVFSACLVLGLAQDYEYSINQDKVSFRQNPAGESQVQKQPSYQYNSFQKAQPVESALLSKYEAIPQIKINKPTTPPQRISYSQNKPSEPQQFYSQNQQFAQQSPQNPQFVQQSTQNPQFAQQSAQPQSAYNQNQFGQRQQSPAQPQFQAVPLPAKVKLVSVRPAANTYVPNTQNIERQENTNTFNQQSQNAPSFQGESDYVPTVAVQQQQPQKFQASFDQLPVKRPAKVRPVAASVIAAPQSAPATQSEDDLATIQEQNANAKYSFSSNVQNGIHDNSLQRQEVRDGLALRGMYAYSDGFFKRTVQYEADENGYRIIKETAEPIGDGPQLNLDGKAQVATDIDGASHGYSITADDIIALRKQKEPFRIVA